MLPPSGGSDGISFQLVSETVYAKAKIQEAELRDKITAGANGDTSPAAIALLQADVSLWTTLLELSSTLTKTISDTVKGILQKTG